MVTPAQICTVGPSRPSDAPLANLNHGENELTDGSRAAALARLARIGVLSPAGMPLPTAPGTQ